MASTHDIQVYISITVYVFCAESYVVLVEVRHLKVDLADESDKSYPNGNNLHARLVKSDFLLRVPVGNGNEKNTNQNVKRGQFDMRQLRQDCPERVAIGNRHSFM